MQISPEEIEGNLFVDVIREKILQEQDRKINVLTLGEENWGLDVEIFSDFFFIFFYFFKILPFSGFIFSIKTFFFGF